MTTNNLKKEIAALRARCESLEKQVTYLQATNTPAIEGRPAEPRRVVEPPCVTVTRLPDRNPSFVMPSREELQQLYNVVIGHYPQLAPRSQQTEEALDGFWHAFLRIGHLGRDKLNNKYMLSGWVDDAQFWLRDHNVYPSMLAAKDFVCAVLSHGDVDYVPLDRFPHDCSAFGLRRDRTGRPASDAWRSVLSTGRLRDPVPLPRPRGARSPTQIAVGWAGR
jgi:hypothetical protein